MSDKNIDGLIDENGHNRAVSMFLAMYGNESEVSIGRMQAHLENCGFRGCAPDWVALEKGVLTIARAREWIRHLFELERMQAEAPRPRIAS